MTRKQIEAAADRAGWNCKIERRKKDSIRKKDYWYVCFNTDTRFGQDVCFGYEVDTLEQTKEEVLESHMNYDPSEEAMLWVGEDGHGKNGAPDDIRDIIADMEEVESKLQDLYTVLNGGKLESERNDKYYQKAIALRSECLSELLSNYHRARPSKFGYDAKGYDNPDMCSKYEEIIYLYGRWVLIDGDSNQYNVEVMPLEEFCEMVDAILKGKE